MQNKVKRLFGNSTPRDAARKAKEQFAREGAQHRSMTDPKVTHTERILREPDWCGFTAPPLQSYDYTEEPFSEPPIAQPRTNASSDKTRHRPHNRYVPGEYVERMISGDESPQHARRPALADRFDQLARSPWMEECFDECGNYTPPDWIKDMMEWNVDDIADIIAIMAAAEADTISPLKQLITRLTIISGALDELMPRVRTETGCSGIIIDGTGEFID